MCVYLSVVAIDLVKLIGERKEGASGQVNPSISPCTTKIYKVLMQGIFFWILFLY